MNRFARRVLAFVSIAGGGLVGAAPTAIATPPDPTPNSAPAATTSSAPAPAPSPDPTVRSGRASVPADPAGPVPSIPANPAAPLTPAIRTGLATDLAAGHAAPPPAPAPAGPPRDPAPTPSPSTSPSSSPRAATANAGAAGAARPPAVSVPAGPPPPGPGAHVTVSGDDLWNIAASHLAETTGRPVASLSNSDVATYWQRVCDANRPRLASGDLNLIYPGEAIALPGIGA